MNRYWWANVSENIRSGKRLHIDDAREITAFSGSELTELAALANGVRLDRKGSKVALCAIVNARSGRCGEDCAFCAQSSHFNTGAPEYDYVSLDKIVSAAKRAKEAGAIRFSIVTSGFGLNSSEIEECAKGIREICKLGLTACASVGVMNKESFLELKKAGLTRYHHNLETAPSFFKNICATHEYEEDVETIRRAKSQGFETCCGGIFGLGESWEQRLEFLYFLAELNPDSVPLNFLIPIPGTPLENMNDLTPLDCIKIIALSRLILAHADILLCGGREHNLRDLQGMAMLAGAGGLMIGDYLTRPGRDPQLDARMIHDAGFEMETL